jgi:hypothetical protein
MRPIAFAADRTSASNRLSCRMSDATRYGSSERAAVSRSTVGQ